MLFCGSFAVGDTACIELLRKVQDETNHSDRRLEYGEGSEWQRTTLSPLAPRAAHPETRQKLNHIDRDK